MGPLPRRAMAPDSVRRVSENYDFKKYEVPSNPSLKSIQTNNFGKLNPEQYKVLQEIGKPHVDSFNYFLSEGLPKAIENIDPYEFEAPSGERLCFEILSAGVTSPTIHKDSLHARTYKVYPAECRSRGISYKGKLEITFTWKKNGVPQETVQRNWEIPIMVKSDACNLNKLKPTELVKRGEEAEEFGGYFIVNGNEKLIRMLILQRRNYPLAMTRNSWKNRGAMFSEFGVSIRCVARDQTSSNLVLHYLTNGTAQMMFSYQKELFFVPIIILLKCLCDVTDYEIFKEMIKGQEENTYFKGCVANMLRQIQSEGLYTHLQIKQYIGEIFRVKLQLPAWVSDLEVCEFLLRKIIAIHLDKNIDKFNLLIFMTRKLFAVAKGECAIESPDNPMNQEVLLGGHLYLMVLKEKLELWLSTIRLNMERKARMKGAEFRLTNSFVSQCISSSIDVGRPIDFMLATGNLGSRSGLGLQQFSGLTIIAEKLNYWRYISHFRCIHRGAFFQEMRTTTVRKLLPEAWGFLCPVHTPDGGPCGLLNHMTALCEIVNFQEPHTHLPRLFCGLGMTPWEIEPICGYSNAYPISLDGRLVGWVPHHFGQEFVLKLRYLKATNQERVPKTLEIAFVPVTTKASQYPGIYMFSTNARMMRPVKNLSSGTIEMIGTFEQAYLDICLIPEEAHEGITTHQEIRETSMLSVLANQIPYSDFNQSPRNMYECQMGKQTMGSPCHTFRHRSDNKMYRIQNPQSPLVRPAMHDYYQFDSYPFGTNAIVAVISYTGYDMEDAMILNKSSLERGFKHGSVYKSHFVNLREEFGDRGTQVSYIFGRKPEDKYLDGIIDNDGLPFIGTKVKEGDALCSFVNLATGETKIHKYKSSEEAYVLEVKVLGNDTGTDIMQNICITLWIQRNAIIGDKFASRHGQKGVCSQKWPCENMPFTESGMTPDILFNPHGFPSRMTIGMMIESMAGKSAALHGLVHDATPFKFSETQPASEYFGELLQAAGYNYFGNEVMYSGVDGRELKADIFFGVVFYQRLRHMVADKFQVRTTGPIDQITHQPVKGRKRAGGIRFGEMERDSLLAHGTSFLLHDRLFNCSDKSLAYVCHKCGSIVSPIYVNISEEVGGNKKSRSWICSTCESGSNVVLIYVPYVFRYLTAELAGFNINLKFDIR